MAMDQEENRVGLTTPSAALAASLRKLEEARKTPAQREPLDRPALAVVPYKAKPAKQTISREQMVRHLLSLDVIFPSQHLSPDQMTLRFQIFFDDLRGLSESELGMACERYRRDPENKFFPTPGALLALSKF